MAEGAVELFFSYSHKDEELRDQLANHLASLKWEGIISDWHDRKIEPGTEWDGEIKTYLNTSEIILLLISADFIASRYCRDIEIQRAMERHDAGEACVVPVILRPVDWTKTPFGKLQAIPKNGKPVTEWDNRDAAFLNVAQGIRMAANKLIADRQESQAVAKKQAAIAEYRQKVEDFATDGEISGPESFILEDLQETLCLTDNEARSIRDQVLEPYGRYKNNLDRYTQAFTNEVAKYGHSLSSKTRTDLKLLQNHLKLSDEDVRQLEEEVIFEYQKLKQTVIEEVFITNGSDFEEILDYNRLQDLLKTKQWKEADQFTCVLMHQALKTRQIRVKDLKKFPCDVLQQIDRIWHECSNGKFGFSAQTEIWQEIKGNERLFEEHVGWSRPLSKRQIAYEKLTFSLDAPKGHFPAFFKTWGGGGWSWKGYLYERFIDAC